MKIPLDDPNITIRPVDSAVEYGLKETTSDLLSENGAIAGVNGDFFGTAGIYSVPLGLQMSDGTIDSAATSSNYTDMQNASLLLGSDGSPFIDYIKFDISFYNDGKINMSVGSVNKTADAQYPTVFTRDAVSTTEDLDARFPNLVKIVVENNVITYISGKGETVSVPEDGYIIVMNEATADKNIAKFAAGQSAELVIKPNIDLTGVISAISGAGKLLENGVIANDTGFISAGRAPRTAIGYTKDKKTLILMVIDGRGHSIGATHEEMAALMLEYGAYDAMHLDGGGSSTMVVKQPDLDFAAINSPSDGSERKIINALGVFADARGWPVSAIRIDPAQQNAVIGSPLVIRVYGVNNYTNWIGLTVSDGTASTVKLSSDGGIFIDDKFYPNKTGKITIRADYGAFSAETAIDCDYLSQINPSVNQITASVGGSYAVSFTGVTADGGSVTLDGSELSYEVYPAGLCVMDGGTFTASSLGKGWIRCYIKTDDGNIETYINVTVSSEPEPLAFPETAAYAADPGTVTGSATQITNAGNGAYTELDYTFKKSQSTQAAYAVFGEPVQLPDNCAGLRLSVQGDSSGDWIRGWIRDANNTLYYITFTYSLDFDGWKDLDTVDWPAGIQYPAVLERIYAVSTSKTAPAASFLRFAGLRSLSSVDLNVPDPETPAPSAFHDRMETDLSVFPRAGEYDVNVVFADGPNAADDGQYKVVQSGFLYAVYLNTANNGIFSSDKTQWSKLQADIEADKLPYLLIKTDASPLNFDDPQEFELFHDLLTQYAEKGLAIFVVSNDDNLESSVTVKDGIRYVNIGVQDEDTLALRIRVGGNGGLNYSLSNMYKNILAEALQ